MSAPAINVSPYDISSRCPLLQIDGVLEFSTRVPLNEDKHDDDVLYVTKPGDKLSQLAFQFYGTIDLWWVLYDINASQLLTHPLDLPPGITLRIPTQRTIELELLDGQSV